MRYITLFISALLVSCSGDDGATPPRWSLLAEGRASSLLGVWGTSATDVWVVGADQRDGTGPTVLHYDGAGWTRLATGETSGDLWWVTGVGDSVFLGGSRGVLLRYRSGTFAKLATPNTNVVFGIWGSAADDVWAVGGLPGGSGAFVWRYDGTTVSSVAGLPADLASAGTVWKVNGCAANDVWMSATSSTVLHYDGASLVREDVGASDESLFSIACDQDQITTAGGNTTNGVLYERDATAWTLRTPTVDGPVLRGIAVSGEHAYAVGQFGAVLRRQDGRWNAEPPHGLTTESLHAAWIDPDGGLWTVGGRFDRAQPSDGVMLYKGSAQVLAVGP